MLNYLFVFHFAVGPIREDAVRISVKALGDFRELSLARRLKKSPGRQGRQIHAWLAAWIAGLTRLEAITVLVSLSKWLTAGFPFRFGLNRCSGFVFFN